LTNPSVEVLTYLTDRKRKAKLTPEDSVMLMIFACLKIVSYLLQQDHKLNAMY